MIVGFLLVGDVDDSFTLVVLDHRLAEVGSDTAEGGEGLRVAVVLGRPTTQDEKSAAVLESLVSCI